MLTENYFFKQSALALHSLVNFNTIYQNLANFSQFLSFTEKMIKIQSFYRGILTKTLYTDPTL